ncbi:NAD(P)-binding domain-containing protein [Trinickia caryophylli]|uniref:Ornithine cyclodeaminase/alanine dehydrogenase n=1 Tax=Trinickia caryophylli TaxID=28094 RepID=A0A1X7FP79_TRICW|nr:ornithine cyclodeaminase family protein [Trinickia caryophylli]PMS09555.1 ornithine cyclodeaminase [Trinickia caryophylli]TRX14412.1 ornithine cyclodeaminase family protein [Trinickia caryophylli]WQE14248.1 NAD(P)-binding domain-containing protein [Trinickia caryophylli]SMF56066.1 ornithine cyclodeaminase/alanine dehydrogenase [Trinickia caryophylli]
MSATRPTGAPAPTRFLSDADVASLADWPSAVAALADAYRACPSDAMVPPRSMARGDGIWLRSLSAVSPVGGHMGCKLIAASPRARRAAYLISLFDRETMALSALIDGNRVTGLRTAATATLAIDRLAPRQPLRVAVIGSGFEARGALECLIAVREIEAVRVFSPTQASRERFADAFAPHVEISAAISAEAAVQDADVVICAARSRDESPVLRAAWLRAGSTVVSLGSTLPEQRELDEETIARAACVVADMPDEVAHDTGDGIAAARAGVPLAGKLTSLAALVSGQAIPRQSNDDIVVYKSVGSALQDVVIAEMLFIRAKARGCGMPLPASIVPVAK